jgi:predicted O-methyltransferase YrrM
VIKRCAKKLAYIVNARWAAYLEERLNAWRQTRKLSARVKAFRTRLNNLGSLDAIIDEVLQSGQFQATQKRTEITELLKQLQTLQPRYLCEIGAWRGGTLMLFCQVAAPNARILSIDLNYTPDKVRAFRHFARPGQRVTCLRADSHSPVTADYLTRWLRGQQLDFLFIDGDHSLVGVSGDFETYAPFVRHGGIVAFHDIVPDHNTRYGIKTARFSGQVPEFWAGVKSKFAACTEFVEDPDQDGYGIGLLYWQGEPVPQSDSHYL